MRVTAKMTGFNRAMERLYGIVTGIAADNKLEDAEIFGLNDWLKQNDAIIHFSPFCHAADLLKRCLADGFIDDEEREDILSWCNRFVKGPLTECMTTAVRRLHGVLHGIAIDNKIRDEEIFGLRKWLEDYEIFSKYWPFNETWELVEHILADGVITKKEKTEFLVYCKNFTECVIDDPKVHDKLYDLPYVQSDSPYLKPFTALCDRESDIRFLGKGFCFTGPARTGPRRKLEEIVKELEGIPYKNVVMDLDYLVIGAQSSPAWAYSTYGRKIERVIELRDRGIDIIILHEDDFISQAERHLPESCRSIP